MIWQPPSNCHIEFLNWLSTLTAKEISCCMNVRCFNFQLSNKYHISHSRSESGSSCFGGRLTLGSIGLLTNLQSSMLVSSPHRCPKHINNVFSLPMVIRFQQPFQWDHFSTHKTHYRTMQISMGRLIKSLYYPYNYTMSSNPLASSLFARGLDNIV